MEKVIVYLLISMVFLLSCTGTTIEKGIETVVALDNNTHSVLETIEISSLVLHKLADLHRAGVDKKIIDEIRDAMHKVHKITDKHHKEHVK